MSIEAELLSKAYNYSPYDNSHTVPEIYKCIFFCDKARNCNGIQIIIMELGIPFDVMLKDDILSLKYKVDKINRILIHYKTLVMDANIYMFDVKPKNATISTKDGSPNIIDFGYKHVFYDIFDFFDDEDDITEDDIKLAFLTIIQLQFMLISINLLKLKQHTTKDILYDLLKSNTEAQTAINNYKNRIYLG